MVLELLALGLLLVVHALDNGNRVAGHDSLLGVRLLLLVEIVAGNDGGLPGPLDKLLVLGLGHWADLVVVLKGVPIAASHLDVAAVAVEAFHNERDFEMGG